MDRIDNPDTNPARPPAGEALCREDEVAPGKIKRLLFTVREHEFRGLLIQTGDGLRGYIDWCPHWGIALQDDRDDIMREQGLIVCAWHWARFSPEDGRGVDGHCYSGLRPWPVAVDAEGVVRTA